VSIRSIAHSLIGVYIDSIRLISFYETVLWAYIERILRVTFRLIGVYKCNIKGRLMGIYIDSITFRLIGIT
jgi:hypothetical protein